jgi:hypothetical protein
MPVTKSKLKAVEPIRAMGPSGFGSPSTSTNVLNHTRKISGADEAKPSSVTFAI